MIVGLTEIKLEKDKVLFSKRSINPSYVTDVEENLHFRTLLMEGKFPQDLDKQHRFSNIYICKGGNCEKVVVVGSPEMIENKLNRKKQILFG